MKNWQKIYIPAGLATYLLRSSETSFASPFLAATWRGISPCLLVWFGCAPCDAKNRPASSWPLAADMCNNESPLVQRKKRNNKQAIVQLKGSLLLNKDKRKRKRIFQKGDLCHICYNFFYFHHFCYLHSDFFHSLGKSTFATKTENIE